jgi:hypothetical protein
MMAQPGAKLTKEELIAQLLLKAQTTTPEEAETLTAKAMELMQKYGIDQAMLNARTTGNKERIEKLRIPLGGIYAKAYMRMMSEIARAYGNDDGSIDTYYSQWKNDVTLTIVGFESDVAQLKVLLASLQLQAVVALNTWAKSDDGIPDWMKPMQKFKARRTFIQSFGQGAASRIRKARSSAVKEAESTTPGTEIVLRDRALAVKDFMAANVGDLKTVKNREKSGGYSASSAGFQAGKNANTGDRQVNAGHRAIEA